MEQQELNFDQKVTRELQAKLGQVVSDYETQLALLRVQATEEIERLSKAVETLSAKVTELSAEESDVEAE